MESEMNIYLRLGLLCLLTAGAAIGQESRGSIGGRVTDSTGSGVPNASVGIVNSETNYLTRTKSGDSGLFEVTLLNPGNYTVTVEASGFKKAIQTGVNVTVAGRAQLELRLELGQVTESIEVKADVPLLDTVSASGGRLLDRKQIMELPFNDLNPFVLVALAPGMQWTGVPGNRRPFDIRGSSGFNTSGGVGQNEYMIDGTPVTGSDRRVGFIPPSDSVEEFRLETSPFDASYGHTSGAVVNVQTKSGTNKFHGSLYDQHWQQRWNATPHFLRLAYESAVARGTKSSSDEKQAAGRSNNFGGTLGGPVRIPKLVNGQNKFFFFFSYNGIYQRQVSANPTYSVPADAWRQGDFSNLLAIDAVKYTVYDPRSARLDNGRVVRTPFPGNRGVPVLNPMYSTYEPFLPKANNPAGLVTREGRLNYLAAGQITSQDYDSFINRYDYNVNERHRVYGRWYKNRNLEKSGDWAYETKPGLAANGLSRGGYGAGVDWVWVIGSKTTMTAGANWVRFYAGNARPAVLEYSPTLVGLPEYLNARAADKAMLPRVDFQIIPDIGSSYPTVSERGTTGEAKIAFNTFLRSHSLKYGYNERRYQFTSAGPGFSSGSFTFDQSYTRQADNTNTADNLGLEWAAFRMGLPTAMSLDTNDSGYWTTPFRALYLHDDWRVNSRLSLNLGLRYEDEGGFTERFDRTLSGEFNATAELPITRLAQAAFPAAAVPELSPANFKVVGGTRYAGVNGTRRFNDGTKNFLPRFGAVLRLDQKTVIRAGYGWFYDTFNVNNYLFNNGSLQYGFSQPTSTVLTTDNGLNFCCGVGGAQGLQQGRTPISNPFPARADGTRFEEPYRNSLGAMALSGRGLATVPRDFSPAFQQRWRIGVQRQIGRDILLDASYNGSWSETPVNRRLSFLPESNWATGNARVQAVDDNMLRNVANPFNIANFGTLQQSDPVLYRYMNSQTFYRNAQVRKHTLLRAYPQYSSVVQAENIGRVRYHDFQFLAEKRFSRGFMSSLAYTYVNSEVRDWFQNEFNPLPSWRENTNARPHRLVWTAIVELPFGKGKRFLADGIGSKMFGGWRTSWIWQRQSGTPTIWANRFYYGDINKIGDVFRHDAVNGQDIHQWFDPKIAYTGTGAIPAGFQGFEGRTALQPGQFHVSAFPAYLSALRTDGIKVIDVKILREFTIGERLRVNFAVDLLNATNHTNFGGPNVNPTSPDFGRVTSQQGLSRVLQFNLRMMF